MQFKPKFIPPDEPPVDEDGELQLPAELTRLGEQLQRDAVRLAEAYPAESARGVAAPPSLEDHRRPRESSLAARDTNNAPARGGRGASFATTLAFVAVTLVASFVFVFISAQQHLNRVEDEDVGRPVESANSDRAAGAVSKESLETHIAAESETPQQSPNIEVFPRGTSPTVLLRDASGPEREGLLDLLELDEVAPHSKISI